MECNLLDGLLGARSEGIEGHVKPDVASELAKALSRHLADGSLDGMAFDLEVCGDIGQLERRIMREAPPNPLEQATQIVNHGSPDLARAESDPLSIQTTQAVSGYARVVDQFYGPLARLFRVFRALVLTIPVCQVMVSKPASATKCPPRCRTL